MLYQGLDHIDNSTVAKGSALMYGSMEFSQIKLILYSTQSCQCLW